MTPTPKILVVDDSSEQRKIIIRLLRDRHYDVVEAESGKGGLQAMATERPDLVILDVSLPDLAGTEVCNRIKSDPALRRTVVILISSHHRSSEVQTEAMNAGADSYVARPIRNRELQARIDAMIRLKQIQDLAQQRADMQAALASFTKFSMTCEKRSGLFNRCVSDLVTANSGFNLSICYEAPPDAGDVVVRARYGSEKERLRTRVKHGDYRTFADRFVAEPATIGDAGRNAKIVADLVAKHRNTLGPGLCIPVQTDDIFYGGVAVFNDDPSAVFTGEDLGYLQSVATVLHIALRHRHQQEALKASECLHRTLCEASPAGIFRANPDGRLTYANARWMEITGIPWRENTDWLTCIHPNDRQTVADWISTWRNQADVFSSSFRIRQPGGAERWVYVQVAKDRSGRSLHGFVGTMTDRTRHRADEDALRVKDRAMAACANGILITDATSPENPIIYNNPAFERITGYTADEIIGRNCRFLQGDNRDQPQLDELRDAIGKGVGFHGVLRNVRRDGEPFWNELTVTPVTDTSGHIVNFIGIQNDITRRKQAEDALAHETERLKITLHSIGDGAITTDVGGRIETMNPVAERLTAWPLADARGLPLPMVFRIINERTGDIVENPVDRVLATGKIVGLANDTILITRDGDERIIADSAAPIHDAHGDLIGVILIFTDITDRCRMDREMQKAQKLESLGVFAGGIAHDFNNLLMVLMGTISIIKLDVRNEPRLAARLERAEVACDQAQRLTQQLLTFASGGTPSKESVDTAEMLREAADFAIHGSNCRLDSTFSPKLWRLDADPGQISQVIQNLISNANQAMPVGGVITLAARNTVIKKKTTVPLPPGRYIRLTIKDAGIGITTEHIERIFDPFFTTKQKGSGLGLSVVYAIVHRHGGHIAVQSKPGQGTTFQIYLPTAARSKTAETPRFDKPLKTGSGRILVMDDDESIRVVVQEMLRQLGYESDVAGDGYEACRMADSAAASGAPYRAAILDLTVPNGLGGKDANRLLKAKLADLHTIVASGYSNDPVLAHYRAHGFDARISKPFQIEDLADILDSLPPKAAKSSAAKKRG